MMRRLSTRAWVVLMIALGLVATASGAGLVLSLHAGSMAQPAAAAASPGPQPGSAQARADLATMQSLLNSGSVSAQSRPAGTGAKFAPGSGPIVPAGKTVTVLPETFRSGGPVRHRPGQRVRRDDRHPGPVPGAGPLAPVRRQDRISADQGQGHAGWAGQGTADERRRRHQHLPDLEGHRDEGARDPGPWLRRASPSNWGSDGGAASMFAQGRFDRRGKGLDLRLLADRSRVGG